MGAWGYGPFDNDSALDFADDVSDAPDEAVSAIRAAMTAVIDGGEYLEEHEVSAAIVGACFTAERLAPGTIANANGRDHAAKLDFTPSAELVGLAVAVFDRAWDPRDNEWYDLWSEAEALPHIRAEHAPCETVLRTATT